LNKATKPVLGKFPTKTKISMTISNSVGTTLFFSTFHTHASQDF
jgi:hypothetical protein